MRTRLLAIGAAALLLSAGPASASPEPHKDGMTVKEMQAWLQESGYKAEFTRDDGEGFLSSAAEGVSFEIYPNDCRNGRCASMQIVAAFNVKEKLTAQKANEWNASKRYVDCYIDAEGDPWFTYDINVSPGGTRAALDDNLSVWLSFLPDIKQHIGW